MTDPHQVLDFLGAGLDLITTILYARASMYCWPIGLGAITINFFLYFMTGLYGDMSIQIFYFLSSLYGWYQWLYGGSNHKELDVTHITKKHGTVLLIICAIGIQLSAFLLGHYTNSRVPYLDAITTVLSIAAQWLTCRKIVETWILWFIVDVIYVGLYFYKGIPIHSITVLIYCGLAFAGYIRWYRLMPKNQQPNLSAQQA